MAAMKAVARRRTIAHHHGLVPAAFPSRLRASGRNLVDANGFVMSRMKGFNIQTVPWTQQTFNDIYAAGGRFVRQNVFWDAWETSAGTANTTQRDNFDTQLARAETAGLYQMMDIHLNVGRQPSWATGQPSDIDTYNTYGQFLTQYLANRYGNPSSPQYRPSVIGFGINEPCPAWSTVGTNAIPLMEGIQRTMIGWFRATAPAWIGFVSVPFSIGTPIRVAGQTSGSMTESSPTAYDSVGGNVVYELHDYFAWDTRTTPPYDARQANGMTMWVWQDGATWNASTHQWTGGTGTAVDNGNFPVYSSSALHQAQQVAFVKPYRDFLSSAQIPLMIGEWGWNPTDPDSGVVVTGESAFIADKIAEWSTAGAAIELQWNYDVSTDLAASPWAARPGGTWRSSTTTWLAAP